MTPKRDRVRCPRCPDVIDAALYEEHWERRHRIDRVTGERHDLEPPLTYTRPRRPAKAIDEDDGLFV